LSLVSIALDFARGTPTVQRRTSRSSQAPIDAGVHPPDRFEDEPDENNQETPPGAPTMAMRQFAPAFRVTSQRSEHGMAGRRDDMRTSALVDCFWGSSSARVPGHEGTVRS